MSSFIPIPIVELPLNEAFSFDLYLTYNKKFVLFRGRNLNFDEGVLNQLRDNGVDKLYVSKEDYPKYLETIYRRTGFQGDNNVVRYLQERFIPLEAKTLRQGTKVEFTVFGVEDGIPIPVLSPDVPGLKSVVQPENQVSDQRLYIHKKDMAAYAAYMNRTWTDVARFSPMNWEGGVLVREQAKMAAHGLFHNTNLVEAMSNASGSISTVLDRMLTNPTTFYSLLKVSEQDFNTYIHSVNVAVLSMGLGMEMKLSDDEMHFLGMGGLLHDIGKRELNRDLLLKKTQVSISEYEQLREHVELGRKFCEEQKGMPEEVCLIVGQHHERLDGSGYPDGLKAEQLHPLAQIVGLMEIYDALTNKQPFRDAFTPFRALEKMRKIGKAINQDILNIFIRMLGNQKKVGD